MSHSPMTAASLEAWAATNAGVLKMPTPTMMPTIMATPSRTERFAFGEALSGTLMQALGQQERTSGDHLSRFGSTRRRGSNRSEADPRRRAYRLARHREAGLNVASERMFRIGRPRLSLPLPWQAPQRHRLVQTVPGVLNLPGWLQERSVFVPLHDGLPLAHIKAPLATRALIGACVMGYVLVALNLLPLGPEWLAAGLGVVPAVLFGTEALPEGLPLVPEPLTLVTSQFMHGSWMHLGGNMLFLWVYGDNVEDAMGHRRFLVFFLLCGAFAGFAHAWMDPESTRPLIGASGAVAGGVAASVILYPPQKLWGV